MSYIDREAALKADYADLGVSCGYIGNCERWGDDRRFMVFTRLSTKTSAVACDVSITVEPKRDAKGKVVEVDFDTPVVRKRLDEIRARLAAGQLHKVGHW